MLKKIYWIVLPLLAIQMFWWLSNAKKDLTNPVLSEKNIKRNLKKDLILNAYKFKASPADEWADSLLQQMTTDEKIGQLFMVAAYSNRDIAHYQDIENLVKKYKIGGLIFFQGGPVRQAMLTNQYQKLAKIPLFVAIDAEWGLGMRLDSTLSYPKQMTLGALENDTLIYKMGYDIASQCKRLGIHINFAPVIDVNSNPKNPVIGFRSFGENKEKVAQKGIAYMRGMQENGVMACGKHFPGHGDTETDSHYDLPLLTHDKVRLDTTELYPFKKLIANNLESIMVAHIQIPAYDARPNIPTTLSENVVTNLLKKQMGFEGLVFTDALGMKGVAKNFDVGEADLLAFLAGNDVLLFSGDVPKASKLIKDALKRKKIKEDDLNQRVHKILKAKYKAGLHKYKPIQINNLWQDLNKPQYNILMDNLYEKCLTVARNEDEILPLGDVSLTNFASISINLSDSKVFQKNLNYYADFEHFDINTKDSLQKFQPNFLLEKVKNKNKIIVALSGLTRQSKNNYGIDSLTISFLKVLVAKKDVVFCLFGNPYTLPLFESQKNILVAYEDNEFTQKYIPQAIFGGIQATGKLPVSIGNFKANQNYIPITSQGNTRLQYNIFPEDAGLNSLTLSKMDTLIASCIRQKIMPGCQVVVARKGKVIWNKAYGYVDYQKVQPVTTQTIYDVASVTKVAGTLQAIMYLYDTGKLDLDQKASLYLPDLQKSNKKDITIRQILLHQAGLQPYLLHWERTIDRKTGNLSEKIYQSTKSEAFPNYVAKGLYSKKDTEDEVWQRTVKSTLLKKKGANYPYEYSDVGFYILKRLAEALLKEPIDLFLQKNMYRYLGAKTLTYKPLQKFQETQIAPTEYDKAFRKSVLRGTVHDPGAALIGGVGGHAGLFSSAEDLVKLLQMNLQKGTYGAKKYFKPETVELFTKQQSSQNRRGLGWDKIESGKIYGYIPTNASGESYGHSGYTGVVVWIDPKCDLIFIMLANRVHPTDNSEFIKQHIRRKVADIVYDALLDKK